jgi:hypothetical protein
MAQQGLHAKNGLKWCPSCERLLAVSKFGERHPSEGRVPGTLRGHCSVCLADRRRAVVYGLTAADVAAMLSKQKHQCAICRDVITARTACVDHDHACCAGRYACGACVRGLLCKPCNLGLGGFRDTGDLMRAGAAYIARWDARKHKKIA